MPLCPELSTLFLTLKKPDQAGSARLKTVVVVDDAPKAQPWVESLLTFFDQVPQFDTLLLKVKEKNPSGEIKVGRAMERLWNTSCVRLDPFGSIDRRLSVQSLSGESLEEIRLAKADILIWLTRCRDAAIELSAFARYGALTVQLGNGCDLFPFWEEAAAESATCVSNIFWHDSSLVSGRLLRSAELAMSQGLYLTLNAEQPVIGAMRLLAALCLELQAGANRFLESYRRVASTATPNEPRVSPSDFEAMRFVARKSIRSAALRWRSRGKAMLWNIALRQNSGPGWADGPQPDLRGFRDLPLPEGVKEMADPFLWEYQGKDYLLFEEVARGSMRGRLGRVEILPDGTMAGFSIILDRPYHLSFPYVIENGNDLFMLPETSEANRVELYRFTQFPDKVEQVAAPLENAGLVDTAPVFLDGRWYFFTTTREPFMETLLFSSERLDGGWELHPKNPVSLTVKNCRSAGQLFFKNGRLFRPTQDCSVRYGYGMALNEITQLTRTEFEERTVAHIGPTWSTELLGTHTWNESGRYQVVDALRYRN